MFINERLLHLASAENLLIVHPHAQRTGGGTMRKRVLVKVFGEDKVYSRVYVPDWKDWYLLKSADLAPYRAYTDLANYEDIGLDRPHVAMALLRDPVHRAVSLYHLIKRKPQHWYYKQATTMDVETFFRRLAPRNPNYFFDVQCRRACGHPDSYLALQSMQSNFIGVGFTNELESFADRLSAIFGWESLNIREDAGVEKYAQEMTPALQELVREQNPEDVALFDAMSNGPPYKIASRPLRYEIRRIGWTTKSKARQLLRKVI
jgi:hypothetical protein